MADGVLSPLSSDEQSESPEQEYPLWLMEPMIPGPQRRSFYYPTMLPGQKRSAARLAGPQAQQRLEVS